MAGLTLAKSIGWSWISESSKRQSYVVYIDSRDGARISSFGGSFKSDSDGAKNVLELFVYET